MKNLSDLAVAYIRTYVPVAWGFVVTAILEAWTGAPTEVADLLGSDVLIAAVASLVTGAWYFVWRKLEPHVPDWVTRLVLGSVKVPTYNAPEKATESA